MRLSILSFLESNDDRPASLPEWAQFRGFDASKTRYSAALLGSRLDESVCFFDQVGLARPVLPLAVLKLVPTIIFAHNHDLWGKVRSTDAWSIRAAALCLTNSDFTLRKMHERYGTFNGIACPLGLPSRVPLNDQPPCACEDVIELRAAEGNDYRLGEQVLLLVARMDRDEREKGHDRLLRVLPQLVEAFPDVQLVFAGGGNDRDTLVERVRATPFGRSVFFPGHVSVDLLQRLYGRCYAYVMPSTQEGFGLTYLEAMNFAKPCIGCYDQGAEDIIVDGQTGFLMRDSDDPDELFALLGALLGNKIRARELGRKGFERLHGRFTAAHFQGRFEQQLLAFLEQPQDSTT